MAALSKAKLASDARHQAKLMQIMVKPYIEEGEVIKAAAAAAGQSTQAYILDAVRAKMAAEAESDYYTLKIPKAAAQKAAEKAGKPVKTYLADAAKRILTE